MAIENHLTTLKNTNYAYVSCAVAQKDNQLQLTVTLSATNKQKKRIDLPEDAPAQYEKLHNALLGAGVDKGGFGLVTAGDASNNHTWVYNAPINTPTAADLERRTRRALSNSDFFATNEIITNPQPQAGAIASITSKPVSTLAQLRATMQEPIAGSYIFTFEDGQPPAVVDIGFTDEGIQKNGVHALKISIGILQPDGTLLGLDRTNAPISRELQALRKAFWDKVELMGFTPNSAGESLGLTNDTMTLSSFHHEHLLESDEARLMTAQAVLKEFKFKQRTREVPVQAATAAVRSA